MNLQQRPAKNNDIAFRDIEDEVFAVAPHSGKYYAFNGVGSYIWQLIDCANSVAKIVTKVTEKYEVAPEVAHEEVVNFIAKLESRGLVSLNERTDVNEPGIKI